MSRAVIVYGPPAAGKDTVTAALTNLNAQYRQFRRMKVGSGRTAGYRMSTPEEVARLKSSGGIVWENQRYSSTYYVDKPSLERDLSEAWPVVHLGQAAAISAVVQTFPAVPWTVVYLWCPREVAERRVIERGTSDVAERMAAWDATEPIPAALTINTATLSPAEAAARIDAAASAILTVE